MKHHIFSSFRRHFSLSLPIYRTHYLCSHFNIILILNGHLVWMQITIIWISNFLPLKKSNNKAAVYLQVVFVYMPYRSGVRLHVVLMLWSCSKKKELIFFVIINLRRETGSPHRDTLSSHSLLTSCVTDEIKRVKQNQ